MKMKMKMKTKTKMEKGRKSEQAMEQINVVGKLLGKAKTQSCGHCGMAFLGGCYWPGASFARADWPLACFRADEPQPNEMPQFRVSIRQVRTLCSYEQVKYTV